MSGQANGGWQHSRRQQAVRSSTQPTTSHIYSAHTPTFICIFSHHPVHTALIPPITYLDPNSTDSMENCQSSKLKSQQQSVPHSTYSSCFVMYCTFIGCLIIISGLSQTNQSTWGYTQYSLSQTQTAFLFVSSEDDKYSERFFSNKALCSSSVPWRNCVSVSVRHFLTSVWGSSHSILRSKRCKNKCINNYLCFSK